MRDFSTDAYPDRRSTVSTLFRSSSTFILSPVPLDYLIHIHFSPNICFQPLYAADMCPECREAGSAGMYTVLQAMAAESLFRQRFLTLAKKAKSRLVTKRTTQVASGKEYRAGCPAGKIKQCVLLQSADGRGFHLPVVVRL